MFNSVSQEGITLSIRNGMYMPFMYKGHQIVVHNASWSGRETIWIDDEVAVTRIGISMTSTHTIEVAGDRLTITFGYRNRMRNVFVEAKLGDVPVYALDHDLNADAKTWKLALGALAAGTAGAAFGYGMSHLVGFFMGAS